MAESTSKPWEHNKAAASGSESDPLAARFVSSLDYDWRLYAHDIAGSLAHAGMLARVGLLTEDEHIAIERGLLEICSEIEALGPNGRQWSGFRVELEDVHMCVEAALIERIGDAGRKLHTGRSRNDQVATDLLMWVADAKDVLHQKLETAVRALVALADRDGRLVMPSYTHLQRAQPIVVGGELLAWAQMLACDMDRLEQLLGDESQRAQMPLGGGAIAGSGLPLDAEQTQMLLTRQLAGSENTQPYFTQPPANSIERTASRDAALDLAYAAAMIAQHLSRWAEQWIIYASTEFGFITLADTYTTGSSMMPQKQNPDMLELVRGKTGSVYGCLTALLTMCKGLPVGYNRDLQEDKRHVFQAFDDVCDCLDMAANMIHTARFNRKNIEAGMDRGFLDATALSDYLVTRGVAFRTSHQIVGALVARCRESDRHALKQLAVDEMNAASEKLVGRAVFEADVYEWLGPENVVKRYQSAGNSGLSGFEAQLAKWRERLGDTSA